MLVKFSCKKKKSKIGTDNLHYHATQLNQDQFKFGQTAYVCVMTCEGIWMN